MIEKINYLTALISSLTLLLGGVSGFIIAIMKNKKELKNSLPKCLKKSNDINMEMNKTLNDLKELVDADRIQLYDFHNGGHYANGRRALKMSCTFEVVKPDISRSQLKMQGLPLACFSRFLTKLYDKNWCGYDDIELSKNEIPSMYNLWKDEKIKSCYNCLITNKYNQPIGLISVQHINEKHSYTRTDINTIIDKKRYIESLLEKLVK